MNELALFAGAGGGILGGHLLGWRTVCAVEYDYYARSVLMARQNDGCLPPFPIWDDVRTFDGRPWRGAVDIVSGGFPCQDISAAGKGAGITGERSGLWSEMARIICEVQPRFVWVENSPMLVGRGLAMVLLDLAKMGFSARWGVVGADDAGAPHRRERIWILAYTKSEQRWDIREDASNGTRRDGGKIIGANCQNAGYVADADSTGQQQGDKTMAGRSPEQLDGSSFSFSNSYGQGSQGRVQDGIPDQEGRQKSSNGCSTQCDFRWPRSRDAEWWAAEPKLGRVAHGLANRVDRLRCIGNGQVPRVVKIAWNALRMEQS